MVLAAPVVVETGAADVGLEPTAELEAELPLLLPLLVLPVAGRALLGARFAVASLAPAA